MADTTSALLRAMLYHSLLAEDIEDFRSTIKAMCTNEEIVEVTQVFEENRKLKAAKQTKA
jgi:hypothetical protein